jgi:uncharacterized repeat protein (TIGR01451 family)
VNGRAAKGLLQQTTNHEPGPQTREHEKENTMRRSVPMITLLAALLAPALAAAASQVSVAITAEKEVTTTVNGQKVTRKVPATSIESRNTIFYTLSYVNGGDEPANNATLDDPIPQGAVYVPGSAYGEGAEITYSIDGGKTFKKPSLLTYEIKQVNGKVEKHTASPEEYTHIRWVIRTIPAGSTGKVGFQVRVK